MSEHEHTPNCQLILNSLSDYIDGELQADLCARLEQHLANCENCRIVVNTLRKTVDLCHGAECESLELPEDIRQRLFQKLNIEEFLNKS